MDPRKCTLLAAWFALLAVAGPSAAQDALRIDELRQDVTDLKRQLAVQSRRIDELERQLAEARQASMGTVTGAGAAKRKAEPAPWLDAGRWDRVRSGMTEAEVVALLGPPTSVRRTDQGSLTLLYALELSGSGYLGGRVVLQSGRVNDVVRPQLR